MIISFWRGFFARRRPTKASSVMRLVFTVFMSSFRLSFWYGLRPLKFSSSACFNVNASVNNNRIKASSRSNTWFQEQHWTFQEQDGATRGGNYLLRTLATLHGPPVLVTREKTTELRHGTVDIRRKSRKGKQKKKQTHAWLQIGRTTCSIVSASFSAHR